MKRAGTPADRRAAAALAQLRHWTPDLLVLDAHLPGIDGYELLALLRTRPALADVPAVMCSADAMPEDIAQAKSAGFTGYWTKPIDIRLIVSELTQLADKKYLQP